jgi:hypothetical protein
MGKTSALDELKRIHAETNKLGTSEIGHRPVEGNSYR